MDVATQTAVGGILLCTRLPREEGGEAEPVAADEATGWLWLRGRGGEAEGHRRTRGHKTTVAVPTWA